MIFEWRWNIIQLISKKKPDIESYTYYKGTKSQKSWAMQQKFAMKLLKHDSSWVKIVSKSQFGHKPRKVIPFPIWFFILVENGKMIEDLQRISLRNSIKEVSKTT